MPKNKKMPPPLSEDRYSIPDEVTLYNCITSQSLSRLPKSKKSARGWMISECAVTLVEQGAIMFQVAGNLCELQEPGLIVILDNRQTEILSYSSDLRCRSLLLSRSFLSRLHLPETLSVHCEVKQEPFVPLSGEALQSITHYYDLVLNLLRVSDNPYQLECMRSLTEAFFYGAGYFFHLRERQQDKNMPVIITEHFMHLLQAHVRTEHYLPFYADALCVSTKYLSECVKQSTGVTALKTIQDRLAQEAASMLVSGSRLLNQIAAELGFEDTETFSKYYKRVTGESPSATRRKKQVKKP